jgi:hypothetical protein
MIFKGLDKLGAYLRERELCQKEAQIRNRFVLVETLTYERKVTYDLIDRYSKSQDKGQGYQSLGTFVSLAEAQKAQQQCWKKQALQRRLIIGNQSYLFDSKEVLKGAKNGRTT